MAELLTKITVFRNVTVRHYVHSYGGFGEQHSFHIRDKTVPNPEDDSIKLLRNTRNYLPVDNASEHRRLESSIQTFYRGYGQNLLLASSNRFQQLNYVRA
jgi:hypothetical protein